MAAREERSRSRSPVGGRGGGGGMGGGGGNNEPPGSKLFVRGISFEVHSPCQASQSNGVSLRVPSFGRLAKGARRCNQREAQRGPRESCDPAGA
mmetsp:Transcript_9227/g.32420  ORF Transcript_9227/g.32420 Transcript_9227/m.32420 type:complete len:94 (-) Transcript_9227:1116-1397(-)